MVRQTYAVDHMVDPGTKRTLLHAYMLKKCDERAQWEENAQVSPSIAVEDGPGV